jgi:hypothetical protein
VALAAPAAAHARPAARKPQPAELGRIADALAGDGWAVRALRLGWFTTVKGYLVPITVVIVHYVKKFTK